MSFWLFVLVRADPQGNSKKNEKGWKKKSSQHLESCAGDDTGTSAMEQKLGIDLLQIGSKGGRGKVGGNVEGRGETPLEFM